MTIKEFLQDKQIEMLEGTNELIINIYVDGVTYCLDVDTSDIEFGTQLIKYKDFISEGDIIKVNGLEIDTNIINVLI